MHEFFKGWKRKAGCVTLAMACVLTLGWVRSTTTVDFIAMRPFNSSHWLLVSGGQRWRIVQGWSIVLLKRQKQIGHRIIRSVNLIQNNDPWLVNGFEWHAEDASEFGIVRDPFDEGATLTMIPYWSIVVPLTLLSAWLLLSNTRPARKPEQSI